MHIILYVFRPFNGFYGCISYALPIMYCLMQKHTPGMFLTDFHTRKYTGGIISRVGIFLTVTPCSRRGNRGMYLTSVTPYKITNLFKFVMESTSQVFTKAKNTLGYIFTEAVSILHYHLPGLPFPCYTGD